MEKNRTIAAVSTSGGTAALGIIRISGEKTFDLIKKCIKNKKKFEEEENRKIFIQLIIDQDTGENIDEVTIIKYGEPFSFTGEDMVEIICHGSENIIKRILNEFRKAGIENAERGEFTKRAFLNGKISLMKAEAINALISSENEIQRKTAMLSYQGSYNKKINEISIEISEILSDIESSIEFSDEDDVKENTINKERIEKIKSNLEYELSKREKIEEVEKGIKVIIAGPANAGKSTLYNNILGYERSIVFDKPGTTRDIINEKINFHGNEITLTDSAGIRETNNEIEKIGIKKSKEEIEKAKIVVWISSLNEKMMEEEEEIINKIEINKIIIFLNKEDISENKEKEGYFKERKFDYLKGSLFEQNKIAEILKKLEKKIKEVEEKTSIPEFIINNRHKEIAQKMLSEIEQSIQQWERSEIAAYYLHNALDCLEEFNGKRDREEIYNNIFKKFCIGK